MLKTQGIQMNRSATIVSDGGETVRNPQAGLSPHATIGKGIALKEELS